MVKVKVLSRNPDEYIKETKRDINRSQRNYDPQVHPFAASREYVRALNATKLDKVFAKPFIGSLDGHLDGVCSMLTSPVRLTRLVTGSYVGELIMWDLPTRTIKKKVTAHTGFVRGLCYHSSGNYFLSCGNDQIIRQWDSQPDCEEGFQSEPLKAITCAGALYGMDHHYSNNTFVTCGEAVHLWDGTRSEPLKRFEWGVDSVQNIKFNPIEQDLVGACSIDRGIIMYDVRGSQPMTKVMLKLVSNAISWNPMESYHFVVGCEDYNAYSFDMRHLARPLVVHKGHTMGVNDVDYSPTGKEFITGSQDRTVRIFDIERGFSREVYHTRRMHVVRCVKWSKDNRFVYTGSDDTNVRLWKARASEKLGPVCQRMRDALEYNDKLKEKYAEFPQIKRILHHRHVPKRVYNQQKEIKTMTESKMRKRQNFIENAGKNTTLKMPTRNEGVVLQQLE